MYTAIHGYDKLKSYQQIGARFLSRRSVALLADDMRLGKTPQAIVATNVLSAKKILVVCPASAKLVWDHHFEVFGKPWLTRQVVYGKSTTIDPNVDIVIINYDLIIYPEIWRQLLRRTFAVGIFDEAHYMKSRGSQRTKVMLLRGGIASRCAFKWALTGTPILNRPIELYPLLKAMAPHVIEPYTSYTAYARHFCGGYWDGIQYFDKGATHTAELGRRLRKNFMLRRTKAQVYPGYREPEYFITPVPQEGETIKKMVAEEFSWQRGEVRFQDLSEEHIATMRKKLGLYMIPFVVQRLRDLFTIYEKIICFGFHPKVLEGIADKLTRFGPVIFHGSTSTKAKELAKDNFNNDPECRLFLGQYQAAGEAIDLKAGKHILFAESSWVPGQINQAADRGFDFDTGESPDVEFMVIYKSLHEHMLRTVIEKRISIKEIIDLKGD